MNDTPDETTRFFLMKEYINDPDRPPEFIEVESLSKAIIRHNEPRLGLFKNNIPGLEFGQQKWWYHLHTLKMVDVVRWM